MTTIKKLKAQVNYDQLRLAGIREKERKLDTRRKIEMGGLIVKAEMDNLSKSVLLGILLHAKQEMKNDPEMKWVFQLKGEVAFNTGKID